MRCRYCSTQLEPDMRFCPECGQPVAQEPPQEPEVIPAYRHDDGDEDFDLLVEQIREMETSEPEPDAFEQLFPRESREQNIYSCSAAYRGEPRQAAFAVPDIPASGQPAQEPVTEPSPEPEAVPEPTERSPSADSDFGDGYVDETVAVETGYRRITAGKRLGSIALCILMALMLLFTAMSATARLTLTEGTIRAATDPADLQTKDVVTEEGTMRAADYLRLKIGSDILQAYGVTDEILRDSLGNGVLSSLCADLLTDGADYFLHDGTPRNLNAAYICERLASFNEGLSEAVGGDVIAFDTEEIAQRINGGDLSFLSIDEDGGYFRQSYGVNPKAPATLGSLFVMIVCVAIAVLCMAMIFVINSANAPAGLNFNGVVTVVIGSIGLLTAAGGLILSLLKGVWVLTTLLRCAAMWLAALSTGALALGVIFLLIAKALKKRARKNETIKSA